MNPFYEQEKLKYFGNFEVAVYHVVSGLGELYHYGHLLDDKEFRRKTRGLLSEWDHLRGRDWFTETKRGEIIKSIKLLEDIE